MCLALPGAYEKEAWRAPTFRMERGKMFLMFADNHHGDGRVAIWLMASPDARELLLAADPDLYFVPPYVGPSGWLGVCIDGGVDWDTFAELVRDAGQLATAKRAPARAKRRRS